MFATIEGHIGATPLVELRHMGAPKNVRLLAKLEGANPSGSIKDRVAQALVNAAEAQGRLKPGMTLIEASTGNTAIALAMIARQRGYGLEVVIPEGVAPAIPQILRTLGVPIHWCAPKAGMAGAIAMADALAQRPDCCAVRQFSSPLNVQTHYEGTGLEIADAVSEAGRQVDMFIAGVGTGGTLMGCGRRLRERFPAMKLVAVEPAMGERLQGLSCVDEGYRPPLLHLERLDGRWIVTAAQSIAAAKAVAEKEGLLVGVSAGATLHVGLRMAERVKTGTIVMIFADAAWKYLPANPWDDALAGVADLDEVHWW